MCAKNRIYGRKPVFLHVPYRPAFLISLYGTGNGKFYINTAVYCTAVTVIRYGAQPYSEVEGSIYKGIENLDKWYNKVNDTDAYFICLRAYPFTLYSPIKIYSLTFWFIVLDPNVKNAYALDKWDAESYAAGMGQLEKVVCAALSV